MNQPFIHAFVPGASPETPTLLLLHGTGGDETSLLELGPELYPGANLLSPRGKVLENGMPRFFKRLSEGVFDEENIKEQSAELSAWIEEAKKTYGLLNSPFYAVGYSNGANIAASLLLLHPQSLKGAVLLRGMYPLDPAINPSLSDVSVLMLNGEQDMMISRDKALKLAESLEKYGASVTLKWQPGGHQISYSDVLLARQWFEGL